MSIHVEIVTPKAIAFDGECEMAVAPGLMGEFGVLERHAQTLSVTESGVVSLSSASGKTNFVVGPGFAEVGPDRITLLVDHCEPAGTVGKEEAKQQLDDAFAQLKLVDAESDEGLQARKAAGMAQARLRS